MSKLNEYDIQFLIHKLKKGESIPDDYKYKLFPTKQKEYELVYAGKMRKEDILANEDGVFPAPLQVEKVFNGEEHPAGDKDWRNMIVFGDNLQFLKTVCENKAPLIKDKIKGKVKLIYIDPPFATEKEFQTGIGVKAYADKAMGADFVEFLRRRLIVARELLADDGSIFVHLDYRKGHYLKVLMDEIFGERNFRNQIAWCYSGPSQANRYFPRKYDYLLFYSVTEGNNLFNIQYLPHKSGLHNTGQVFGSDSINEEFVKDLESKGKKIEDWWIDIWATERYRSELIDYPTQKPEKLLERIIKVSTNEGDLLLDFFCGSGTVITVAEKLNRRWIGCDIGKLSFYTMQKRILTIQDGKDLENPKKKYGKKARSFVTVNTGLYDLQKVFKLKKDDYINFVINLFEVESVNKKIGGIKIDGQKKDGYYVIIYPYWEFKKASVDEEYLEDLNSNIGKRAGGRLYIIAPANYVDFISDYHEIDKTKYYFLKVPYQIIKELHKVQFKKFRQPQSKRNVNDLDDAIGFHFIRQPEVESKIVEKSGNMEIHITKFLSNYLEEETDSELKNFESLAMALIDNDYNDREFVMDEFYFAEDLLPKKKKAEKEDEQNEDEIKEDLKRLDRLVIPLNKEDCGDKIMVVYVDIYGNEFKEVLSVKK